MKRGAMILSGLSLMIITGYLREFLFVNINWQLSYLWYDQDVSNMSEKLSFLNALTYEQLYYLKWPLTLICALIYYFETIFILRWFTGESSWKVTAFLFMALTAISGVLYAVMFALGKTEDGYLLARYFMGLAQSPVPLMVLLPILIFKKRFQLKR